MDTSSLFDVFNAPPAAVPTTPSAIYTPKASKRKSSKDTTAINSAKKSRAAATATASSPSAANGHELVDLTDGSVIPADDAGDQLIDKTPALSAVKAATHVHTTHTEESKSDIDSNHASQTAIINANLAENSDEIFNRYTEQIVDRWVVGEGGVTGESADATATPKTCIAEICYPPNWPADKVQRPPPPKPSDNPAKKYPYTLDPFQLQSIACLERYESVLVSAHTSAGKTTVAEYAIAMSLRSNQRVIYTSPIKALSNQKFRELQAEFTDVGLMTGDITINPSASCLVMTTEILRNMLYKGSEMMREIAWVIFDEVHYMRNKERGVVWEETFCLLPHAVRYVLLSATIPNAAEFACWIAKLHNQPCNVVYTDYRPTPLQHYIYPSGADGLYLIVDDKHQFRSENFEKAIAAMAQASAPAEARSKQLAGGADDADGKAGGKKRKKSGGNQSNDIYKIIRMLIDRHYDPVIVFSFSKKECETYALQMSKLDLCDADEKALIKQIFSNAIDSLSPDDRQLPQVENILPLLLRGVGIHHGGLLPILKEVIEILFGEGLLKVLFSTETFSMGLNMPAKTVVFTALRKYDGDSFRVVSSGEYIQMSGRAGRRGIDDRGICITMLNDETVEPVMVKEMMQGNADRLDSSFHLSYNMILNLVRVEDQTPIKLMCRSFAQFQNTRKMPALEGKLQVLQDKRQAIMPADTTEEQLQHVQEYYSIRQELQKYADRMHTFVVDPQYILQFLNAGRMVKVRVPGRKNGEKAASDNVKVIDLTAEEQNYGWGVVISYTKRIVAKGLKATANDELNSGDKAGEYFVDVLLYVDSSTIPAEENSNGKRSISAKRPLPSQSTTAGEWHTVAIQLSHITHLSSVRLNSAKDSVYRSRSEREKVGKSVREVLRRFETKKLPTELPLLDPIEDMHITDPTFLKAIRATERLEQRLNEHPLHNSPALPALYTAYEEQVKMGEQIEAVRQQVRAASTDVTMYEQLRNMTKVLRRLEHTQSSTDAQGQVSYIISNKGRVACEISTADELLATEMIFSGVFTDLTSAQCAALVSALVYNERSSSEDEPKLPSELQLSFKQLQECARKIGNIQIDAGMELDVEEYVASFQPHLISVVYAWCHGAKFSEVCKMTDAFEGSIIRALRRLEEALRQYAAAAKSIGNTEMETKFNAGIELLKRDIVFAASLYL